MEREKFVYLTGLLPVLLCSVMIFFWLMTAAAPVSVLGVILSLLSLLIALIGCFKAFKYYTDSGVSDQERRLRRKHFLGHSTALSLGLVFSFQSFQYFRHNDALFGKKASLIITIKNTSMEPAKDISIQVGSLNETIKEIPANGKRILTTNLAYETKFIARHGSGNTAVQASITVGPDDHNVLLRIDAFQNLLPEVN